MLFPGFKENQTVKDRGFSLVELMIVVGIIGILAALAIPRFQRFQAKARMAEAKNMLSHIFTLEEAYHLESNTYTTFGPSLRGANCGTGANMEDLGLDFTPCNATTPRYIYTGLAATNSTFTADAKSGATTANDVCPGSPQHEFTIDQDRDVKFSIGGAVSAIPKCG